MDGLENLEENLLENHENPFLDQEDGSLIDEMNEQHSLLTPSATVTTEENKKPGEEEEFEEEEDDDDFKFEENEEEEEEGTITDKELEDFNKKLGTNFKTVDELKKSFEKHEVKSEEETDRVELEMLNNKISLFDTYLKMDNEELIRNQFYAEAKQKGKDPSTQEIKDEIEDKIEALKDLDTLDSMANNLRSSLSVIQEKDKEVKTAITSKYQKKSEDIQKQNRTDLQHAFSEILKEETFMGVVVDKETLMDVYKDVRSEEFFKRVNNDQRAIAELALFVRLKEEIKKAANKSTPSDETKKRFNQLAGNGKGNQRSITTASSTASNGGMDEVLKFIK